MKRLVESAHGEIIEGPLDSWLAKVDRPPARGTATREIEVWHSWFVLVLFVLLVGADCYLRKRQGLA